MLYTAVSAKLYMYMYIDPNQYRKCSTAVLNI